MAKEEAKLLSALWGMSNQSTVHQFRYRINSTTYDLIKRENSKSLSKSMIGHSNNKGIVKSEKHKQKLSEYRGEHHHGYGKKRSEHSNKMMGENNPMFGKIGDKNSQFGTHRSQKSCELIKNNRWDSKRKAEQAQRARTLFANTRICPHCEKEGTGLAMYRYHFDNCKKVNL